MKVNVLHNSLNGILAENLELEELEKRLEMLVLKPVVNWTANACPGDACDSVDHCDDKSGCDDYKPCDDTDCDHTTCPQLCGND